MWNVLNLIPEDLINKFFLQYEVLLIIFNRNIESKLVIVDFWFMLGLERRVLNKVHGIVVSNKRHFTKITFLLNIVYSIIAADFSFF